MSVQVRLAAQIAFWSKPVPLSVMSVPRLPTSKAVGNGGQGVRLAAQFIVGKKDQDFT